MTLPIDDDEMPPPPLWDIPSGCYFFLRPSLRVLRQVAAFCQPLQPLFLLVSLLH